MYWSWSWSWTASSSSLAYIYIHWWPTVHTSANCSKHQIPCHVLDTESGLWPKKNRDSDKLLYYSQRTDWSDRGLYQALWVTTTAACHAQCQLPSRQNCDIHFGDGLPSQTEWHLYSASCACYLRHSPVSIASITTDNLRNSGSQTKTSSVSHHLILYRLKTEVMIKN